MYISEKYQGVHLGSHFILEKVQEQRAETHDQLEVLGVSDLHQKVGGPTRPLLLPPLLPSVAVYLVALPR